VLLHSRAQLDDLQDVPIAARRRIHDISQLMSPRVNLEMQSKVIARSRAFVGTHGGLSYLGPLTGVRSVSFYSDATPAIVRHLEVARRAFTAMRPGSYVALHISDLDTLRSGLGERHDAIAGIVRG
jgi:hypothetical protein